MEVFVRNIPEQCSDRQLTQLFKQSLKHFEDPAFLVQKLKNKNCAKLTISNVSAATKFLQLHSQRENALQLMSRSIICQGSYTPPDPFVVQSLQLQDEERHRKRHSKSNGEVTEKVKSKAPHTFAIELCRVDSGSTTVIASTFWNAIKTVARGPLCLEGRA